MSRVRVLLAGNPNAGKTTLFNRLTGSTARVGNYPGVTVECSAGTLRLAQETTGVLASRGAYAATLPGATVLTTAPLPSAAPMPTAAPSSPLRAGEPWACRRRSAGQGEGHAMQIKVEIQGLKELQAATKANNAPAGAANVPKVFEIRVDATVSGPPPGPPDGCTSCTRYKSAPGIAFHASET